MIETGKREQGPDQPSAAFRTISETADMLDLPQHVLRFWETRFVQIRPLKRGGGRRYYRAEDVDLLRGIKHLLYGEGYTIKGVQRILKAQGVKFVQKVWSNPASLKAAGEHGPTPSDHDDEAPQSDAPMPQAMSPPDRMSANFTLPLEHDIVSSPAALSGQIEPIAPLPQRLSEQNRLRLRAMLSDLIEARRIMAQANSGPLFVTIGTHNDG